LQDFALAGVMEAFAGPKPNECQKHSLLREMLAIAIAC